MRRKNVIIIGLLLIILTLFGITILCSQDVTGVFIVKRTAYSQGGYGAPEKYIVVISDINKPSNRMQINSDFIWTFVDVGKTYEMEFTILKGTDNNVVSVKKIKEIREKTE